MIRKPSLFRKALTVGLMLTMTSLATLTSSAALAASAPKAAGELMLNGEVTLNGTPAIAGATVFSDSTLKTANGYASLNLGKLGRIELGPHSEMLVRFAPTQIGGNLRAGRAVVNAPMGVAVSVATAKGTAVSEGKQPAMLAVDVNCGNTQVAALRSDAKLLADNKVEYVAAGTTAVTASSQVDPKKCARLVPPKDEKLSDRALALLLLGLGGAVAGIICAVKCNDDPPPPPPVSGFRP
ncbi:MAG: hypothetical protein HYR56_19245 [Acidobacteria bacterium]|nr:hypothetical protein [Acidobacteriota bacterium]MBI3421679.1 hypothetical protein [Acidobacteriota bacterium]